MIQSLAIAVSVVFLAIIIAGVFVYNHLKDKLHTLESRISDIRNDHHEFWRFRRDADIRINRLEHPTQWVSTDVITAHPDDTYEVRGTVRRTKTKDGTVVDIVGDIEEDTTINLYDEE